jgi:hypothetical protein
MLCWHSFAILLNSCTLEDVWTLFFLLGLHWVSPMRQDQPFILICVTMQLPNVWEDELHNVVQMSYGTNAPLSSQDADGIIFFYPFCTNPLLWYTPYCSQVYYWVPLCICRLSATQPYESWTLITVFGIYAIVPLRPGICLRCFLVPQGNNKGFLFHY